MDRRLLSLAAAVAIVGCLSAAGAAPATAREPLAVTVGIQFATDRTHVPSGTVIDEAADAAELNRLGRLLEQSDGATALLLIDPATRHWLREFEGTALQPAAEDLLTRADARAHMDTVHSNARIDKLVASRLPAVAQQVLAWGSTSTVMYLPAAGSVDAKTQAFLALHPTAVTAIASGSVRGTLPGSAGLLAGGAAVVVRDTPLESCFIEVAVVECMRIRLTAVTSEALLAVTPRTWDPGAATLRAVLAELRSTRGITLSGSLPDGKTQAAITNAANSRKYAVPLREPMVRAAAAADALAVLYERDRVGDAVRQSTAAAMSDTIDATADPAELLLSAQVRSREAEGRIRITTSGHFTVSGGTAEIPVTVVNDATETVSVSVRLASDSPARLSSPATDAITIEAGTRVTVPVTVTVNGLGTVGARVALSTADGRAFGQTVPVTITSTAYQTFARNIVWAAFALLVVLAANNLRTRRVRR